MIELLDTLIGGADLPEDRLLRADALAKNGVIADALAVYDALGRSQPVTEIRSSAFSWSTQLASDNFDHATVERITGEWLEFDPGRERVAWGRLFALHRLGRSQEALQLAGQLNFDPEPNRQDLAELLVAVLSEGDLERAARRMMEISDRFGRPEPLEAAFLTTALRVRPGQDRLADLSEQIRQRLQSSRRSSRSRG